MLGKYMKAKTPWPPIWSLKNAVHGEKNKMTVYKAEDHHTIRECLLIEIDPSNEEAGRQT